MDNITEDSIKEQVKTKETEAIAFAKSAQEDINKRNQDIQSLQIELQAIVKGYQKEIDRREGAIEQLNALLGKDPSK